MSLDWSDRRGKLGCAFISSSVAVSPSLLREYAAGKSEASDFCYRRTENGGAPAYFAPGLQLHTRLFAGMTQYFLTRFSGLKCVVMPSALSLMGKRRYAVYASTSKISVAIALIAPLAYSCSVMQIGAMMEDIASVPLNKRRDLFRGQFDSMRR